MATSSGRLAAVAAKCGAAFVAGALLMLAVQSIPVASPGLGALPPASPAALAAAPDAGGGCLGLTANTPQLPSIINPRLLEGLSPFQQQLISNLALEWGRDLPSVCFAPDTPAATVRSFYQNRGVASRQRLSTRWSTTATNGSGLQQGDATTLTWSIVPDGTSIPGDASIPTEVTSGSNLKAFFDGIYGSSATWQPILAEVFARWSEVTGVTYVYQATDDGAAFPSSPGVLNTRGDIRLSGHFIDGPSNILAYNYYPNGGDMVIDTGDTFFNNTTSSSIRLKNVLSHEHGHGLGLDHVCPLNNTKLMEPFINTNFSGPQVDDVLGGNRGYGDRFGNNDTVGNATNLGTLANGLTTVADLSIDDNGDTDFHKFTVAASKRVSITLRPTGGTYLEGADANSDSCATSAGISFAAQSIKNLGFELISIDSTTVLSTANSAAAGSNETLTDYVLTPGAGTYYVRVFGDTVDNAQLYALDVTINDTAAASTVLNVTSTTANGAYGAGTVIPISVTFNEAVTVVGVPLLLLETGTTDTSATYASGSGTTTLVFNHTVLTGSSSADLDYASTSALSLNGGTIKNAGNTSATLTLPAPGAAGSLGANKALVINAPALTVTNVTSSTVNGTYGASATIPISVTFSEAATVTGTPSLLLETGFTDASATYTSGSGTTTLIFTYTVVAGHNSADLDYASASALSLNGGTISSATNISAVLTLPSPGAAGSLGANKALVINAPSPPVISSGPTATPSTAGVGQTITLTVAASDANGDALTYAWNFGDGSSGSGASVSHVYTTAGTYTVSVTVSDGNSGTVSGSASVLVSSPSVGSGSDTDGDGFSDDFETLAGTSPTDGASSPLDGETPPAPEDLSLSKLSIKLNFSRPLSDSLSFSGVVALPTGFDFTGELATIDVGGVVRGFELDYRGKSPRDTSTVSISKPRNGFAKYTVKISREDLAADLEDDGLIDDDVLTTVNVPVTLIFNGQILELTPTLSYKAKAGRTGSAK
jgi:PKD repeat protein